MILRVDLTEGTLKTLWSDDLPLDDLGRLTVTRASVVEFDAADQAWYVALPEGPVIARGFKARADALEWERTWADATLRA